MGYEIAVPLGVMERLPAVGERVTLATELVVREDGWSLYGFTDDAERRFFQRLLGVAGVGPKIAIALLSALGAGARRPRGRAERDIAALASVSGIGKKTAERLALELADKLGELEVSAAAGPRRSGRRGRSGAQGAGTVGVRAPLRPTVRCGEVLAADGGGDDSRRWCGAALQVLTARMIRWRHETAEWICTRCGSTNRKLVPTARSARWTSA